MLDIKFIRENKKDVQEAAKNKQIDLDVEKLLLLDEKRLTLLQEIEELNAQKNNLNDEISKAKDKKPVIAKGKIIKDKLSELDPEYKKIKKEYDSLMVKVPMVPSEDTPIGKSEDDNKVIFESEKPNFDFEPKDHIEIGEALDIIDFDRGAKISGYRGYYLKNEGAMLVMAMMQYAFQKMISKGYLPMLPPTLAKENVLFGSGYFKGVEYDGDVDEIYQVATSDKEADGKKSSDKKFLVGTAEPVLLAYYSGEVLDERDLPLKFCGFSPCYRSEIGSYGKETKGLYRVHEFYKVEQVVIAPASVDLTNEIQKEMVDVSKEMHEELGLPYRQLQICTADMGTGKYKMFDIEAWMPGMDRWGETGSASNLKDWQSRRLNIRYKDFENKKHYPYLLNNTALPSVRPLIAILENFQQEDGSVIIPEVLRPWMGGIEKISKEG
jgi:seryl-tRNA synthetase